MSTITDTQQCVVFIVPYLRISKSSNDYGNSFIPKPVYGIGFAPSLYIMYLTGLWKTKLDEYMMVL